MDEKEQSKVIAFDTLFSTNHIAMLKIMLPYLDYQTQRALAVSIKFMELRYTMELYKNSPYPVHGCMEKDISFDFVKLSSELLPYCTEKEKEQLTQLRSAFQSMEMYQELSKTMEMMKDFMPDMESFSDLFENFSASDGEMGSFDFTDILKNMMTPKQQEMFHLFGGNQHE